MRKTRDTAIGGFAPSRRAVGFIADGLCNFEFRRRGMKALKLFWSRGHERNAGDWFSPLICERLSGRPVVYADPRRCDLVAAGSLLGRLGRSHPLHRLGFRRRLDIWGTGSLRSEDRLLGDHRLHALRGRLTLARSARVQTPPCLGDPGLLAGLLLDDVPKKRHGIGLIPHLSDRGHAQVREFAERTSHVRLLDLTSPVGELLIEVARCECVLSTGLHGLVFADALGVPNRWATASGALIGGRHKFDDYYSAFDMRPNPVRLSSVDVDAAFDGYSRPGIEKIRQGLLASFPFR